MFATTLLLRLVPEGRVSGCCGTHLDFKMDNVIEAVDECVAIGATVERSPGLYPDDTARPDQNDTVEGVDVECISGRRAQRRSHMSATADGTAEL